MLGVVILATALGLLGACSASSHAPARTTPALPTLLPAASAALRVRLPFTADDGALVVTPGAPPVGFNATAADREFSTILEGTYGDPHIKLPHELLAGRVTLVGGLGVPPLPGVAAWVVVYPEPEAACAVGLPDTTLPPAPPDASGLYALIFTEPGAVNAVSYQGAGTGSCGVLSAKPKAWVWSPSS
jgi:hypothetical protein